MTETTKAISERLGNEGYAFANVNAAPELDKEKRRWRLPCSSIRAAGSMSAASMSRATPTRDEVIRRECASRKSAWYDGEKINKSRTRVDKLGYFDEVTVETPPVPGTTDQVDMDLKVKEKPTGNIMLGAGFSSRKNSPFPVRSAAEPVRQRQACRRAGQHQQVESGLFAFAYRSLFHRRRGQPGLRYLLSQTDTSTLRSAASVRIHGRRPALGGSRRRGRLRQSRPVLRSHHAQDSAATARFRAVSATM
jgi:hypothetical protein